MNPSILFATGNARKITEATHTLSPLGITIETTSVDTDEIQHHEPEYITKAKARAAFDLLQQPVVVQDTSWNIPALGGFPGGYMKDVANWWTPQDWTEIMTRHTDKTIYCLEHVVYYDGITLKHFEASYKGTIVASPRGEWGNSIEKVVCLYGDKTLAEVHDTEGIASASETLEHWKQFGDWFINQQK